MKIYLHHRTVFSRNHKQGRTCGANPISYRTLVQLQPDIIVAKLSGLSTSPSTIPNDSSTIEPRNPLGLAVKETPSSSQSWGRQNFLGTMFYSYRQRFTHRRSCLGELSRREERAEYVAMWVAPSWLINRVWSVQAVHLSSGWTFSPRSYNVVPQDSAIFVYVRDNNTDAIKNLFSHGEASPFDCDELGRSLLHVRNPSGPISGV